MNKSQMKVVGIVCLIICAICVFVAVERYQANNVNVDAMNAAVQALPMPVNVRVQPAAPAVTLYAGFFALLSGVGGIVLLLKSK